MVLQGARESVFTTKADHSFFTEPVSCQVFNAVGKTNVSILVDVHCESHTTHLTLFNHSPQPGVKMSHSLSFPPLVPLHYSKKQNSGHLTLSLNLRPQSARSCWWSRSQKLSTSTLMSPSTANGPETLRSLSPGSRRVQTW